MRSSKWSELTTGGVALVVTDEDGVGVRVLLLLFGAL